MLQKPCGSKHLPRQGNIKNLNVSMVQSISHDIHTGAPPPRGYVCWFITASKNMYIYHSLRIIHQHCYNIVMFTNLANELG